MSDRTDRLRELAAKLPPPSEHHRQHPTVDDVLVLIGAELAGAVPPGSPEHSEAQAALDSVADELLHASPIIVIVNKARCPDLTPEDVVELLALAREEFS